MLEAFHAELLANGGTCNTDELTMRTRRARIPSRGLGLPRVEDVELAASPRMEDDELFAGGLNPKRPRQMTDRAVGLANTTLITENTLLGSGSFSEPTGFS